MKPTRSLSDLGFRGGDRGDRRGGPPRLRTDHDFYKQLKFKTTANGQIGEEDVKRIFGAVGKVTKGSEGETDRKDPASFLFSSYDGLNVFGEFWLVNT